MVANTAIGQKILVIDDDPMMRQFMAQTLRKRGHQLSEAQDGQSGLALVKEFNPELVICDVNMEGMDGFTALKTLKENPATATIPFILITAEPDPLNMRAGMGLGADDYLPKPFSAADLIAAVDTQAQKRAVLKRQAERQLKDLRSSISLALPHELFTPLNAILGYAELIHAMGPQLGAKDLQDMSQEILSAGSRLHRLLQNYVTFAQFEMFRFDPEKVATLRLEKTDDALEVVTQAVTTVATAAARPLDLILSLMPATLRIRREHLAKLVEELASNAFKFSKTGSKVRVFSFQYEGQYHLEFMDAGRGMTSAQIESIGAYSQFDRDKHEQQGLGLGLAISQRILLVYGGRIQVKCCGGHTTVSASIPLAAA